MYKFQRFVLLATVCACAEVGNNLVEIAPASTAAKVVFRVTTSSPAHGLAVLTCDDAVMWSFGTDASEFAMPAMVTYGEVPQGFTLREGPRALRPGCYKVVVSDARPTRFTVAADGSVTVQGGS